MPSNNDKKKYNATCAICGKPYNMCYSCDKKNAQLVWKRFCCCPEHYKIYQLVHGYTTGLYTKSEAKRKLKNIDTSDIDELRSHIRDILMDIMGSDKSGKSVVEDKVDAEENTETVETYVSSEQLPEVATQSSTKPRRTRKRSVAKVSDDMNDASDDTKSEPVEA